MPPSSQHQGIIFLALTFINKKIVPNKTTKQSKVTQGKNLGSAVAGFPSLWTSSKILKVWQSTSASNRQQEILAGSKAYYESGAVQFEDQSKIFVLGDFQSPFQQKAVQMKYLN